MPVTNVRDVVNPIVFHCFQIFGYAVLVAAWGVAVYSAVLIVKSAVNGRQLSLKLARPSRVAFHESDRLSPNPARRDPAKVIAFAKTRVVIR